MDQINRQYIIFSATIAAGISFIFNFFIIELVKTTPLYGFPIALGTTEGFINWLFKFTNTVIIAAALTFPVYYTLMWLQRRR